MLEEKLVIPAGHSKTIIGSTRKFKKGVGFNALIEENLASSHPLPSGLFI